MAHGEPGLRQAHAGPPRRREGRHPGLCERVCYLPRPSAGRSLLAEPLGVPYSLPITPRAGPRDGRRPPGSGAAGVRPAVPFPVPPRTQGAASSLALPRRSSHLHFNQHLRPTSELAHRESRRRVPLRSPLPLAPALRLWESLLLPGRWLRPPRKPRPFSTGAPERVRKGSDVSSLRRRTGKGKVLSVAKRRLSPAATGNWGSQELLLPTYPGETEPKHVARGMLGAVVFSPLRSNGVLSVGTQFPRRPRRKQNSLVKDLAGISASVGLARQ